MPTRIAVGVASPRAHGQAMISTETARTSAVASFASGAARSHAAKVTSAMPSTIGVKMPLTVSASLAIGAFEPCAS